MTKLYLAWQDPLTRSWHTVGRLTVEGDRYQFVYTQGALQSPRFAPLGSMEDLHKRYESAELFPLFANRILAKSRPEYRHFLHWLNLNEGQDDPLELLALTEGIRRTDTLMVFRSPERRDNGTFSLSFFSHGLRHLPEESIERVAKLTPGQRLYLMLDVQNEKDEDAIAVRTEDPASIAGYCPRYLARDFRRVILNQDPREVEVRVERVNPDAPIQLRLLCHLSGPWPEGFQPCEGGPYAPLA